MAGRRGHLLSHNQRSGRNGELRDFVPGRPASQIRPAGRNRVARQFNSLVVKQDRFNAVALLEFFEIFSQRRLSIAIESLRCLLRARADETEVTPGSVGTLGSGNSHGEKESHEGYDHSEPEPDKYFDEDTAHDCSN